MIMVTLSCEMLQRPTATSFLPGCCIDLPVCHRSILPAPRKICFIAPYRSGDLKSTCFHGPIDGRQSPTGCFRRENLPRTTSALVASDSEICFCFVGALAHARRRQ